MTKASPTWRWDQAKIDKQKIHSADKRRVGDLEELKLRAVQCPSVVTFLDLRVIPDSVIDGFGDWNAGGKLIVTHFGHVTHPCPQSMCNWVYQFTSLGGVCEDHPDV